VDPKPSRPDTSGADVLRGIAIIMVVAYHAMGPSWGWYVPWSGWLRDFSAAPSRALLWCYPITFGWAGVSLFFVISGFCIHYSYLRAGRFEAKQFFWRRVWRIYPAYIVALLAFQLLPQINLHTRAARFDLGLHALMVHNASQTTFFGVSGSFWSIAVEVQLYLLFPLLLVLREKVGIEKAMVALFAVGCAWRSATLFLAPLPDHLITAAWTCPLNTWFDWSLGALVAERFASGRRTFSRAPVLLAVLIPALVASSVIKPLTIFSFMLASAVSAVRLDAALRDSWSGRRWAQGLSFIGAISYSIYLWHQPLLEPLLAFVTKLTGSPIAAWSALPPMIVAISWLSFELLERPGINAGRALANAWAQRSAPPSDEFPTLPSVVPGTRAAQSGDGSPASFTGPEKVAA
jgi:peptidoglycan/LPS O-acetylase OafA/YrhL